MPNLGIIFITGLTVGGFSCMAVQGGLLASVIAARENEEQKGGGGRNVWPTLAFLTTKFIAYSLLGFILGAFGGALTLSDSTRALMQLFAGFYMIAVALDLLQVHPLFRYAVIQPPRFLSKVVRTQAKGKDVFAPALLGAMTIFIPCGTTLAMEALAISTGNAFSGLLVMSAFVLGTTPLFFGLGMITSALGDKLRRNFFKLAGFIVIYLGFSSVTASLNVLGYPLTWQTIADIIPVEFNVSGPSQPQAEDNFALARIVDGVQQVDIRVLSSGYDPTYVKLKQGIPVRVNLSASGTYSCAAAFTIPKYNIRKMVPRNGSAMVEFTPTEKGKILYTCSMGMYSGTMEVI